VLTFTAPNYSSLINSLQSQDKQSLLPAFPILLIYKFNVYLFNLLTIEFLKAAESRSHRKYT
jgi:hypothetical protein